MSELDYYKHIIILDDFYQDPVSIRNIALAQKFGVPVSQTNEQALGPIARRVPCPQSIYERTYNRILSFCDSTIKYAEIEFRYTTINTVKRQVCHADGSSLAGIIYLTPAELCQGGTWFFKHKPTGHYFRYDNINYDFRNQDDWELTFKAKMKFNRLVFYPGKLFHAVATPYFGSSIENARLTQNLFFYLDKDPELKSTE